MPPNRLRLTITGTYEFKPEAYGTDDPFQAARLDAGGLDDGQVDFAEALDWLDSSTITFTIEPDETLEEKQARCPAHHGSQCCGYPEVCSKVPDLPDSEFE